MTIIWNQAIFWLRGLYKILSTFYSRDLFSKYPIVGMVCVHFFFYFHGVVLKLRIWPFFNRRKDTATVVCWSSLWMSGLTIVPERCFILTQLLGRSQSSTLSSKEICGWSTLTLHHWRVWMRISQRKQMMAYKWNKVTVGCGLLLVKCIGKRSSIEKERRGTGGRWIRRGRRRISF